jgi:carbonic anhydrase
MCNDPACSDPSHKFRFSRRAILAGSAAVAATWIAGPVFAQDADAPQNAISPDAALTRLMDGNARYVGNVPLTRDFTVGRAARVSAQYPVAAVLGCADSRIAPELAFDQGPGDVFVVRLAGNFANDDGIASLEYAVRFLNVPLVMVLGHSNCGAVEAAIKVLKDGAVLPGHLPQLVAAIQPAVAIAQAQGPTNLLDHAIAENVRQNVKRLGTTEPILADLANSGKIKIVGGLYDLATGKVALV